jgi:hypothetical protein
MVIGLCAVALLGLQLLEGADFSVSDGTQYTCASNVTATALWRDDSLVGTGCQHAARLRLAEVLAGLTALGAVAAWLLLKTPGHDRTSTPVA